MEKNVYRKKLREMTLLKIEENSPLVCISVGKKYFGRTSLLLSNNRTEDRFPYNRQRFLKTIFRRSVG